MIIHISRERLEKIKSQGYPLGSINLTVEQMTALRSMPGDTEYHAIDGEVALCETCGDGAFYTSITANTPAELDTVKWEIAKTDDGEGAGDADFFDTNTEIDA